MSYFTWGLQLTVRYCLAKSHSKWEHSPEFCCFCFGQLWLQVELQSLSEYNFKKERCCMLLPHILISMVSVGLYLDFSATKIEKISTYFLHRAWKHTNLCFEEPRLSLKLLEKMQFIMSITWWIQNLRAGRPLKKFWSNHP